MLPGKPVGVARSVDVAETIETLRYYAGWAEKLQGKHIPISSPHLCYTRHVRTRSRMFRPSLCSGARRRGWADHPVELSTDDDGLEAGPRARDRVHYRTQELREDSRHCAHGIAAGTAASF
jgi:hypothetical protein